MRMLTHGPPEFARQYHGRSYCDIGTIQGTKSICSTLTDGANIDVTNDGADSTLTAFPGF